MIVLALALVLSGEPPQAPASPALTVPRIRLEQPRPVPFTAPMFQSPAKGGAPRATSGPLRSTNPLTGNAQAFDRTMICGMPVMKANPDLDPKIARDVPKDLDPKIVQKAGCPKP